MDFKLRLVDVQERIALAAARSGRLVDEITLVAVTKTWPGELILAAQQYSLHNIGENRIEELAQKRENIKQHADADKIIWHQIGSLQSRKTNLAADNADVFHALDRIKVANRLSKRLVENKRATVKPLPVFLEVNISGESSKAGISCSNWQTDGYERDELLNLAIEIVKLPGLTPMGLMTMAPWQVAEPRIRQVFQQTRLISEWLQNQMPDANWSNLSMGMTDDFEMAIEEGSTHIRVGRAIFGERN